MKIWDEMQEKGLIEQGCILRAGEPVSSSFPPELKKHLAVAKQSLSYIFRSVGKTGKNYNEAHMEIGDKHFSGYLLSDDIILICMCSYGANQQHLGKYVEERKENLLTAAHSYFSLE